jgi:prolyl 4-hydroxylase
VFFSYLDANASCKAMHGGAPVIPGEKWIATRWFPEWALPDKPPLV